MTTLNKYKIEHKILTLSDCAVIEEDKMDSFEIEEIVFSHWDFNVRDGWIGDAWLATSTIFAKNFHSAFEEFNKKMFKLIPRISLISQAYIEYITEPFLIHKIGSDIAFFRCVNSINAVGLMFMQNERKALEKLIKINTIPEEFYYYWNDAVNAIGYPAKLLLMFSAIESLVKKNNGKKNWDLTNQILGEELVKELFGTKEESSTGLRHRLVHGEYFNNGDQGKNYLDLVHKKVINYFNSKLLSEPLLSENVVNPQRHFFGNKEEQPLFVRSNVVKNFTLKKLLENFGKNGFRDSEIYSEVYDDKLNSTY